MASNYPPDVTGNEPQITGDWPCKDCGATLPETVDCYECGKPMEWDNEQRDWWCPPCDVIVDGDTCPGGCREPEPND